MVAVADRGGSPPRDEVVVVVVGKVQEGSCRCGKPLLRDCLGGGEEEEWPSLGDEVEACDGWPVLCSSDSLSPRILSWGFKRHRTRKKGAREPGDAKQSTLPATV